jgi:phosphate transport system protein
LAQALEALEMGDQDKAGAVIVSDTAIDDLHLVIEEQTFRTLTLQQPLAGRDLRYLTSLVPMTIELERIGDEAVAIAQNVLRMIPFRSGGIY